MRFLLSRTDALGDLMVSLPVMARILEREPGAEIHWLVRPATAPILEGIPGVAGVHLREPGQDLAALFKELRLDAVLNLGHRDKEIIPAAKAAGVKLRIARARGIGQILSATHRIWKGRTGTGRREAQHALDFLAPFGWDGGEPETPRLVLSAQERAAGEADLTTLPHPRLGLALRGSGAGAAPSEAWWTRAREVFGQTGWHCIALAPPEASEVPPGDLRRLMTRLAACDAVLSPSTGPAHIAAALGVPTVCLMGRRAAHGPDRWKPLGPKVIALQYPGVEADAGDGMDRLDPAEVLRALETLR
ncbi:MAG TPA: glycosyltransferase family 9 protein [Holophagaceae bacterium]|nr:glycosyltransferase family 9 protein [Holophagaceae bacterium]